MPNRHRNRLMAPASNTPLTTRTPRGDHPRQSYGPRNIDVFALGTPKRLLVLRLDAIKKSWLL